VDAYAVKLLGKMALKKINVTGPPLLNKNSVVLRGRSGLTAPSVSLAEWPAMAEVGRDVPLSHALPHRQSLSQLGNSWKRTNTKLHDMTATDLQGGTQDIAKAKRRARCRLQDMAEELHDTNPYLRGLSPLYADYEAKCWWWQILTFLVTLILCGPMLLLPAEAASQVFIQLVVSTSMMVALANANPYMHRSDDILAQMCQVALTFAMSVGILEMASEEFRDATFGPILVACTTIQLGFGFTVAFAQWAKDKMPGTVENFGSYLNVWATPDEEFFMAPRQLRGSILVDSKYAAKTRARLSTKVHPAE